MPAGYITNHIDLAQLALYVFWLFFAGLIYYLRQEDKREGFPLISDKWNRKQLPEYGFPPLPKPKVFRRAHGEPVLAPKLDPAERPLAAQPTARFIGAPLEPTGDAMLDGVGPAAWCMREDVPDQMFETGEPKIIPLRIDNSAFLAGEDPDPRGMQVVGADGVVAGTVRDAWNDRADALIRYLEVSVNTDSGVRNVLVPMFLCTINTKKRQVRVESVMARHFQTAPVTREADFVTLREEDQISAYFGGGHMYATASRAEPLI